MESRSQSQSKSQSQSQPMIHIYLPDGETISKPSPVSSLHNFNQIPEIHQYLPKGYVEHVSVLFNNKPSHMFVHESGRLQGLPRNEKATDIYYAASVARGFLTRDPMYFIVGPAIVLENVTME